METAAHREPPAPGYDTLDVPGGVPVRMWTRGVPIEPEARRQLENVARLPFVFGHVAAMPDVTSGSARPWAP